MENKDEKYYKTFYNELLNAYGEITTDNEKLDAYINRSEVYSKYSYKQRCSMILNDYRHEIIEYDKVDHNRSWSIVPRYYSYIGKTYYEEKYNGFLNTFEILKLKEENNEELDKINYDINQSDLDEFREKIKELVSETKEMATSSLLEAVETYKLIDKKMYDFFNDWCKNHKYENNNMYMRLINIMKSLEKSFVRKCLEEERINYIKEKAIRVKDGIKFEFAQLNEFASEEAKLVKKYFGKNEK